MSLTLGFLRWHTPARPLIRGAGLGVLALLLAACSEDSPGGPEDGEPVAMPSFQIDVKPILASSTCASTNCHSTSRRAGGLVLADVEPSDLIGRKGDSGLDFVLPSDAQDSYLVRKLEGRAMVGGGRMPLGRSSLPGSQIGTIRNWIELGAEDN